MAKITFEVGDIVKVAGDKVGIVLPDKKVLVAQKEIFNSIAEVTDMVESDLFPIQDEDVNKLDHSIRVAFKAVRIILGVNSDKIATVANLRS